MSDDNQNDGVSRDHQMLYGGDYRRPAQQSSVFITRSRGLLDDAGDDPYRKMTRQDVVNRNLFESFLSLLLRRK
jgi:hypothetical protein